ncbi:MAG: hypothetical protein R3A13_12120 [Bdellovibrionota bacterium]
MNPQAQINDTSSAQLLVLPKDEDLVIYGRRRVLLDLINNQGIKSLVELAAFMHLEQSVFSEVTNKPNGLSLKWALTFALACPAIEPKRISLFLSPENQLLFHELYSRLANQTCSNQLVNSQLETEKLIYDLNPEDPLTRTAEHFIEGVKARGQAKDFKVYVRRQAVRQILKNEKLSISVIAKLAMVSKNELIRILNGESNLPQKS